MRTAFTLLELLIVISTIMVLVALLLPAVQQAREAARRAKCGNNMRQLVLALAEYHDAYDVLPPGSTGTRSPVQLDPTEPHFSWIVRLLPFVGERTIFDRVDFENATAYADGDWDGNGSVDVDDQFSVQELEERAEVRKQFNDAGLSPREFAERELMDMEYLNNVIAAPELEPKRVDNRILYMPDEAFIHLLSCPSDPGGQDGHSNYVGLHHHVPKEIGDNDAGLLFLNSAIRLDDIDDGLAVTAILAESSLRAPVNWATGTRSTLRYPVFTVGDRTSFSRQSIRVTPANLTPDGDGVQYDLPPEFETFSDALAAMSVSSSHPNVFHVAMIDGRVNLYSTSAGVHQLQQSVNRSDAAPLEDF